MNAAEVTVRQAVRGDIPSLLRMWSLILGDIVRGHPHFRPTHRAASAARKHLLSQLERDDSLVLVATYRGNRVGFLNASLYQHPFYPAQEQIGLIENVYVDPGMRGGGAASALMTHVMQWLEEKNVKVVEAVTEANNNRAIGFFGKFGFDLLTVTLLRPLRGARDRRKSADRRTRANATK